MVVLKKRLQLLLFPKTEGRKLSRLEENILSALYVDELPALQLADVLSWNSGGRLKVGIGTLVPKLRRLERLGFVKSRWSDEGLEVRGGNRRKYYLISSAGAKVLQENLKSEGAAAELSNFLPANNRLRLLILTGLIVIGVTVANKYLITSQKLPVTAQATIASHTIGLEVSRTQRQQAIGLMYRTTLADNRGMLFPFEPPQSVRFWMKNTLIPLDMVFLQNGVVNAIAVNVPPCTAAPCPVYGPKTPISQVIELRGGQAAKLGLNVGDRLPIKFLP